MDAPMRKPLLRPVVAGATCLLALVLFHAPVSAQHGSPSEPEPGSDAAEEPGGGDDRALRWYELAMRAFKEKRWGEAALAFDAAYRYHADPTLLFNAARAYQRDEQLEPAKARYEDLLKASGVDPDIRQRAVDAVVQVEVLIREREAARAREDARATEERETAEADKERAEREALEARLAQLEQEARDRDARQADADGTGTRATPTRGSTRKPAVAALEDDDEFAYDARRQPNAFAQRSFAMPGGTFGARGALYAGHISGGLGAAGMQLTLGYGITDEVEIGAHVLPATFAPRATYGPPGVYGVVHANAGLEFGMLLGVNIPVGWGQVWSVPWYGLLTLPMGDIARFDVGLGILFAGGPPVSANLDIPFSLSISVAEEIFVEVFSGIYLPRFNDAYMTMPFGIGGGYTLTTNEGPMADVMLHLQWPRLYSNLQPDDMEEDTVIVSLSARFYVYL